MIEDFQGTVVHILVEGIQDIMAKIALITPEMLQTEEINPNQVEEIIRNQLEIPTAPDMEKVHQQSRIQMVNIRITARINYIN